jgi:hypothetical protein
MGVWDPPEKNQNIIYTHVGPGLEALNSIVTVEECYTVMSKDIPNDVHISSYLYIFCY